MLQFSMEMVGNHICVKGMSERKCVVEYNERAHKREISFQDARIKNYDIHLISIYAVDEIVRNGAILFAKLDFLIH